MGNSNEVGRYISEAEQNRIIEQELRIKKTKQKNIIKELDKYMYIYDWKKSYYKKGGYGKYIGDYDNGRCDSFTIMYLVRIIYHWYSNSKC